MIKDNSGRVLADPSVSQDDFNYFAKRIHTVAGITLKDSKLDMVKTRLRTRLWEHGFNEYSEYRKFLESIPQDHPENQIFVNLLTTNKTEFFREPKHFDFLITSIIPKWLKTNEDTFKVWSAAASTGEEAYTLAMVLKEHLPADRDFKILSTDIDTKVLKTAQNAVYPIAKLAEIPDAYRSYIDLGKGEVKDWFRIKSDLKSKVVFKPHNLMDPSTPGEQVFDLTICRNVLIYFDREAIQLVSQKMYHSTKADGYLMIGHAETFQNITHSWITVGPSVFAKGKN